MYFNVNNVPPLHLVKPIKGIARSTATPTLLSAYAGKGAFPSTKRVCMSVTKQLRISDLLFSSNVLEFTFRQYKD
jgi:hypothetical protein